MNADLPGDQTPVPTQLLTGHLDDRARDRKPEALASARRRDDERVDSDNVALDIDERSAAVAMVDGRVGLDVHQRAVRVELTGGGADDPHRDRLLQPKRSANREDYVPRTGVDGGRQACDRQVRAFDLNDSHVSRRIRAN